jgi:hypothetical protein
MVPTWTGELPAWTVTPAVWTILPGTVQQESALFSTGVHTLHRTVFVVAGPRSTVGLICAVAPGRVLKEQLWSGELTEMDWTGTVTLLSQIQYGNYGNCRVSISLLGK